MPDEYTDELRPTQSPKRKAIGKKLRFEIFKRDAFTCVYCGRTPPNVTLEADHVIPVAGGGDNSPDNLVCSCMDCNRGKSANSLKAAFASIPDRSKEIQEREAQMAAYNDLLASQKTRKDDELWGVADIWIERFSETGIPRTHLASIRRFLDSLAYVEVAEAMEIACDKMSYKRKAFLYFCGICWRKIRALSDE